MRITAEFGTSDFRSYRAARVRSLFNLDEAARFSLDLDLPLDDAPWSLGLVVGPSGSGKSTIGARIFADAGASLAGFDWPDDAPIVDAIAPAARFDSVTSALAAVGLGSVPAWLRPYGVLSNGERFRAMLARVLCEAPERVVIDEFTSVVDRQVARVGALAFAKAWRRTPGRCVLLSCHYDIIDWVNPDWVLDTATGAFTGRCERRRPGFEMEIRETDWRWWPAFEPHHYLKLPRMIAASNYVGFIDGEPVAHVAFSTRPGFTEARAARLVVMPQWQGLGIGMRLLNAVCAAWRRGRNRYGRPMLTLFHTSHPGLAASLRRDPLWAPLAALMHGDNKEKSRRTIDASQAGASTGYGGHFRAIQGFRYVEGADVRE